MTEKIGAKQLLEEINKLFPDLKHIAKDLDGQVLFYEIKPKCRIKSGFWSVDIFFEECYTIKFSPEHSKTIDWGTDNWTECIYSL